MAGTQESILKEKIRDYKTQKDRLDTAKHTPAGPGTEQALKTAQRDRDSAWSSVSSAYSTYAENMRSGGHTPKSLGQFLRDFGTSEN